MRKRIADERAGRTSERPAGAAGFSVHRAHLASLGYEPEQIEAKLREALARTVAEREEAKDAALDAALNWKVAGHWRHAALKKRAWRALTALRSMDG